MSQHIVYQKGSLLIPMVFLIVSVAVLGSAIAYYTINQSTTIINESQRVDAFYTAQAGIERASYALLTHTLADQLTCADISSTFTAVNFGSGQFSVTGTLYNPTSTTLATAVSANAVIIPVTSVTGYAPKGSISIDSEVLRYNQTSTSAGSCGGYSACFLGVIRAQLTSTASSHTAGSSVVQDQCTLQAQSGIPTIASPTATQSITAGVQLQAQSSGNGWMVASKHANGNETTIHYDGTAWTQIGPSSDVPNKTMFAVYASPSNTGWIVGEAFGSNPLILSVSGTTITYFSPLPNTGNKDLYAVTCVTSNDCWITGQSAKLVHWNGSAWSLATLAANVPSVSYRSVNCTSSSNCWAVGDVNSSRSTIVQWNGSLWTRILPDSATNQTLYGVSCITNTNCWAVGASSLITHWDGTSWVKATGATIGASVPAGVTLRGITCSDSTHCWAVGSANSSKGTILFFNGSSWARATDNGTLPNQQLNSVDCNNNDSCWAVGNAGVIVKFDGTNWSNYASLFPDVDYYSISLNKTGTTDVGVGGVVYTESV